MQAVDFISDLHLAAGMPRTFAAWSAYLRNTPADVVFILGDLFEIWVGDDMGDLEFEASCLAVLARSAVARPTWVQHGNRDFLLGDRFARATGVQLLPDPTAIEAFGQTLLATHGDALCIDDVAYQLFRAQVRAPAWQQELLSQSLEARLALAAKMRAASRAPHDEPVTYADADPPLADAWLRDAGAATLVHGHTHRPGSAMHGAHMRHVLSDWDLDTAAPAARRGEVLRWTAEG
ncbi:MAG TPA: UDP-2,3-diacylglucosamine diphosphatase, partial [Burkholderiaceae bacterium]|nr:UDP-2,3-diacylglucosamine diphosphatase [Burkholderiaceae bacterium]